MMTTSTSSIATPFSTADATLGHIPPGGWQQFYSSLTASGNVPNAQINEFSADNTVIYAPYLDLSTAQSLLGASGFKPNVVTIYADILNISGTVTWQLGDNMALIVYARFIDFQSGGAFSVQLMPISKNSEAAVSFFAGGTNGQISVSAGSAGSAASTTVANNNISPGIIAFCVAGASLKSQCLDLSAGVPSEITDEQVNYLFNGYVYAALCSSDYCPIALDILLWVNAWVALVATNNSNELAQLYFASSSLTALLQSQTVAAKNGTTWVPYLSRDVYANLAATMGQALQNAQQNYLTLFTAKMASAEFIAAAKAMQNAYSNDVQRYTALLQQADSDYQNALKAANIGNTNFSNQQTQVTILGNDLNANIKNYVLHHQIETALTIGEAIIEFGAGIAELAVGDPEGAAGAVGAIAKIPVLAQQLKNAMTELKKLADALLLCFKLAQQLYDASQNLSGPDSVDPDTAAKGAGTGNDPINGVAAWDVFKIQSDLSLAQVVGFKIDGAAEYQAALGILTVYGKALSALQLAVIQASQNCVSLSIQIAYANKNVQNIQNLVNQLTQGESDIGKLQQLFFRQSLDARITLFSVLKAYQATYYYWALTPSGVNASLTDLSSLTSNLDQSVAFGLDYYRALINGTPQALNLVEVPISDPNVISTLNQTGATKWTVGLDNPAFANFDRLRFDGVRIWLIGDNLYPTSTKTTVYVVFKTSGNYLDRYRGKQFQFSSPALEMTFEYYVNDNNNPNPNFNFGGGLTGTVAVDGAVAIGSGNDYFEPTPFSEWRIDLNGRGNTINFANIKQIVMQFQGSAFAAN